MSAAQIAKRTRIKRDTINNALAVAKSDLAKAAADRYDFLTLEQAAAVAEFDDDDDAVKELIVTARNGSGFGHLVQQLRDQRAEQARQATHHRRARRCRPHRRDRPGWTDPAKPLSQIPTDEQPTPEAHATCPGHVVRIEEEWTEGRSDDAEHEDDEGDG
jgi:ParB family transcriptional regulator, chromosome partitioning protein